MSKQRRKPTRLSDRLPGETAWWLLVIAVAVCLVAVALMLR